MGAVDLHKDGVAKVGMGSVVGAGLLGLVLYASTSTDWAGALGGGLVVAAAFAVAGAGVGFLFGIPRLLTSGAASRPDDMSATSTGSYSPNTNLEQVSDWLTKILLGAGLTQIGSLPGLLRELGHALAPVVGNGPGAPAFAAALTVYFTVIGFLSGWLLTRLRLAKALSTADRQTLDDSVRQTRARARELNFTTAEVEKLFATQTEGLQVQALALLQGDPDPENYHLILRAVSSELPPFVLLQALLAAKAAVEHGGLAPEQRRELRFAVENKMRNDRAVPPDSRRRVVAGQILKLLAVEAAVPGGAVPEAPEASEVAAAAAAAAAAASEVLADPVLPAVPSQASGGDAVTDGAERPSVGGGRPGGE
ncbi:hypothetical protein GCM10020229_33870 [Kitasatospora albolonga]